jgi:hypothetical protein
MESNSNGAKANNNNNCNNDHRITHDSDHEVNRKRQKSGHHVSDVEPDKKVGHSVVDVKRNSIQDENVNGKEVVVIDHGSDDDDGDDDDENDDEDDDEEEGVYTTLDYDSNDGTDDYDDDEYSYGSDNSDDDSDDRINSEALAFIDTVVEDHNAMIHEQKASGAVVDGGSIAGKDFYMFGVSESADAPRRLAVWDASTPGSSLVAIPLHKSFSAACIHPGTGRIVGVLDLETADDYLIFVVLDAATSEIVCGFNCVSPEYMDLTFSASGAYCLLSTGDEYNIFDSNTGKRIVDMDGCLTCSFTLADEGMISYDKDDTVRMWEIDESDALEVSSSKVKPDSRVTGCSIICSWYDTLAAIKMSGCYTVWNYRAEKAVLKIPSVACDAVFTCIDTVIILRPAGQPIEVWNLTVGAVTISLAEGIVLNDRLCYIYSRNTLVKYTAGEDGVEYLELWDVASAVCTERINYDNMDGLENLNYYSEPVSLLM